MSEIDIRSHIGYWHLADLRVMSGLGHERKSAARGTDANDPNRTSRCCSRDRP